LPLWGSRRTLQATLQGTNSHLNQQPAHHEKANPPKGGDAKLQGLRLKYSATTASCRNGNLHSLTFGPWTCCNSVHGLFFWQAIGVNGVSRVATPTKSLRDRCIARAPMLATLVVGTAATCACVAGPAIDPQLQTATAELPAAALTSGPNVEADSPTPSSETLTLQGWLSIVWNGEPHFFLQTFLLFCGGRAPACRL
jgi:hypothetical protein